MSEDAGAAGLDAGTAEGEGVTDADATSAEDGEAAGLLGGMLENDPEALAAELAKWKGQARKWEDRAKVNSDAAARLKELDQKNMTELEKAQAAQHEAEGERDRAIAMHNRVMAAAANNLPVELIDYLPAGTEEEIMSHAETLAGIIDTAATEKANALLAQQAGRNGMPGMGARPVESLRAGSAPASGGTPQTADDWFRQLLSDR
jgi:hypothetical protein